MRRDYDCDEICFSQSLYFVGDDCLNVACLVFVSEETDFCFEKRKMTMKDDCVFSDHVMRWEVWFYQSFLIYCCHCHVTFPYCWPNLESEL